MKNKVLLIFPGQRFSSREKVNIPLSLMVMIPPLEAAGFQVDLFDQRVDDPRTILRSEYLQELIWAGFTILTGSPIHFSLELAAAIRRLRPDLPLVYGGYHATLKAEETLATSTLADIVVRGEGEVTAVGLTCRLAAGLSLAGCLGVSFKEGERVVHNPDRPLVDLDAQSPPPYSRLDPERYLLREELLFEANRGCPFRCRFCDSRAVTGGRRARKRDPEKVLRELVKIDRTIGPKHIFFVDNLFFLDQRASRRIMEGLVAARTSFTWYAQCRADIAYRFGEDYVRLMRDSGCVRVFLGAESGSPKALKYLQKEIQVDHIVEAVRKLDAVGITSLLGLMSAFPTDTQADLLMTMDLIDRLESRFPRTFRQGGINLYTPLPGSEVFDDCVGLGFQPPTTLAGWGEVLRNDRLDRPWLDKGYAELAWRVALVSRWSEAVRPAEVFQALRQGRLARAVRLVFAAIFRLRWRRRFFKFPLDLWVWFWGLKRVARQG